MDSRPHDEVLRDIVRSVEQNTDLGPDHPDLLELKRILLEKITPLEIGDSRAQEMIASGDPPAALPVDASVNEALGLGAAGDPPALPADIAVTQVLGLGIAADPPATPTETGDSERSSLGASEDPSAPPVGSA
jgi:hypothetical protein